MKINELMTEDKNDVFINNLVDSLESARKIIQEECQEFIRNNEAPLFRTLAKPAGQFFSRAVRKDRVATSSSDEGHFLMDEWLEKKVGIKGRSQTLFTSNDFGVSEGYGSYHYFIFPKNDYTLLWYSQNGSNYKDTLMLINMVGALDDYVPYHDFIKMTPMEAIDYLMKDRHIEVHTGKKIPDTKTEISIQCEEFFAVQIPKQFGPVDRKNFYKKLIEK